MNSRIKFFLTGAGGLLAALILIAATTPGIGPETDWIKQFKRTADSAVTARTNIFGDLTGGSIGDVFTKTNANGSGEFKPAPGGGGGIATQSGFGTNTTINILTVTQSITQVGGGIAATLSGPLKFSSLGGNLVDSNGTVRETITALGSVTFYGTNALGVTIDKDGILFGNVLIEAPDGTAMQVGSETTGVNTPLKLGTNAYISPIIDTNEAARYRYNNNNFSNAVVRAFELGLFGSLTNFFTYVDPAGSDTTGDGTFSNPMATYNGAVRKLRRGIGTIYQNPGRYTNNTLYGLNCSNVVIIANNDATNFFGTNYTSTWLTNCGSGVYQLKYDSNMWTFINSNDSPFIFEYGTPEQLVGTSNRNVLLGAGEYLSPDFYRITNVFGVAPASFVGGLPNGTYGVSNNYLFLKFSDGGAPGPRTVWLPQVGATNSAVYGCSNTTVITMIGVRTYFANNGYTGSGARSINYWRCVAGGSYNEGFINDTMTGVHDSHYCISIANNNDGMGYTAYPFLRTNMMPATEYGCVVALNGDEGTSMHFGAVVLVDKGAYLYNHQGGGTPYGGGALFATDCAFNYNDNGGAPSGSPGQIGHPNLMTIFEANNCDFIGNRLGVYLENGSSNIVARLRNCHFDSISTGADIADFLSDASWHWVYLEGNNHFMNRNLFPDIEGFHLPYIRGNVTFSSGYDNLTFAQTNLSINNQVRAKSLVGTNDITLVTGAGAGKVLTSDANGKGNWQNPTGSGNNFNGNHFITNGSSQIEISTNLIVASTEDTTPDGANDFVLTYDFSASAFKKVKLNNLPSSGTGEANVGANLGSGTGLFAGKTGVTLNFNTVSNNDGTITISSNNNTVTLSRAALTGDVTTSGNAATIAANAVDNTKLRDSAGYSVIGKATTGSGDPADIAAGTDTVLGRNGSGDLGFAQVATTQIANDAVTYAKIQNITATQRVLGRNTAGSGDTEEVTLSQLLDWIGSAAQGDIIYRGASTWSRLAAGTSGQFLQTAGAGANPVWATSSASAPGGSAAIPFAEGTSFAATNDNTTQFFRYNRTNGVVYNGKFDVGTIEWWGNRLVAQANVPFYFGVNSQSNWMVDVNGHWNPTTNNLDIGSPTHPVRTNYSAQVVASNTFQLISGGANGKVLTSDAGGVGSWQTPASAATNLPNLAVGGLMLSNVFETGVTNLGVAASSLVVDWNGPRYAVVTLGNFATTLDITNQPSVSGARTNVGRSLLIEVRHLGDPNAALTIRHIGPAANNIVWQNPSGNVPIINTNATNFLGVLCDGQGFLGSSDQVLTDGSGGVFALTTNSSIYNLTVRSNLILTARAGQDPSPRLRFLNTNQNAFVDWTLLDASPETNVIRQAFTNASVGQALIVTAKSVSNGTNIYDLGFGTVSGGTGATNAVVLAGGTLFNTNQFQVDDTEYYKGSNGVTATSMTNTLDMTTHYFKNVTNAIGTNITWNVTNVQQTAKFFMHLRGLGAGGYSNKIVFAAAPGVVLKYGGWPTNGDSDIIVRPGFFYNVRGIVVTNLFPFATNVAITVDTDDPYVPANIPVLNAITATASTLTVTNNLNAGLGQSTSNFWPAGTIYTSRSFNFTNLGNAIATLTNLGNVTIPANALTNAEDAIRAEWYGTLNATVPSTNRFTIFWGSQTLLDTGNQTTTCTVWRASTLIQRAGPTNHFHYSRFAFESDGRAFSWLATNVLQDTMAVGQSNIFAIALGMQGGSSKIGGLTNNLFKAYYEPAPH